MFLNLLFITSLLRYHFSPFFYEILILQMYCGSVHSIHILLVYSTHIYALYIKRISFFAPQEPVFAPLKRLQARVYLYAVA